MRPKTPAFLWDIQQAAKLILEKTSGLTPEEMSSDVMLRSAIERQLEIAGEAARRLADSDRETASKLPGLRSAIGIRNVIAHQYDRISWTDIRDFIDGPLARLEQAVSQMLDEIGPPGASD